MTRHSESSFARSNGLHLYSRTWRPNGTVRAAVALVHGVGEHSGRYMTLVERLTASGFAVSAFDHRGHGKSPGKRGHINAWSEYREDVRAFLGHVRQQFPGSPVFLYGHSLGGLIVAEYVLWYQEGLAGLIVSGIPIQPTGVAKPYLLLVARILSRIWPSFSIPLKLDPTAISRDPAVIRAYRDDPLVHPFVSARWGVETLGAIDRVRSRAVEIRLPLLVLHGEADRIDSVDGSRELFDLASSADKELRVYPDGSHEPHNDLDRAQVAHDVERWLERHTTLTGGRTE